MKKPDPAILVIFGASGDLTHRKLLPALFSLYKQELFSEEWAIVGVGRSQLTDIEYRQSVREDFDKYSEGEVFTPEQKEAFLNKLYFVSLNTSSSEEYRALSEKLAEVTQTHNIPANYLFYLSTPPSLYPIIPVCLADHGLNCEDEGWRRLIVEKPFGYDPQSALELNQIILAHFKEHQIYRIDHYLGKETVQNLLVFRFSNEIFEPLWSRKYLEYVEITSAESLGVEKRGGYYDQSGAVRDMLQNHLLQILAMVAMEPPAHFDARSVRNETLKVFQSLRPLDPETIDQHLVLGQYTSSIVKGESLPGYREEQGVSDESRTETYVALKAHIDNWRWSGVPFYIRTGKRLPTRVTEVVLHFRKIPNALFGMSSTDAQRSNMLVIRIQPDEGIQLSFGLKEPGSGFRAKRVTMDFHYSDLSHTRVPSAYERLLLDCLLGDATLYARGDAVEACWDYIAPVLDYKAKAHLFGYPAGTWGPKEADEMLSKDSYTWRFPCKNLTNDQNYCEL